MFFAEPASTRMASRPVRLVAWRQTPGKLWLKPMKNPACHHRCAAARQRPLTPSSAARRRGRRHRPLRRHHCRLARQFLHRQPDRAEPRADGRALRAARRRLQDRAIWRRQEPAIAGREDRRDPSRLQDAGDAGASRHRRCGAAAPGHSGQGKSDRRVSARRNCRSSPATVSPSPASASPCAATARARARSARRRLSRPASPARCRFAWSIRPGRARRTDLAPAPAIPARPVFEDEPSGACDHRRGELVDGPERQRRLRRSHRRDAANALSRLDFADRAAMGFRRWI